MVKVTINNQTIEVNENTTILKAAKELGITIPTLCHMDIDCFDHEHRNGSCRICMVEVDGRPNLAPSCCTPVTDGMSIKTHTSRAINSRRVMLDLLLSDHPKDCLTCEKNLDCELQALAEKVGLHRTRFSGEMSQYKIDLSSKSIVRDLNKCVMCRRCETACNDIQTCGVLAGVGRGFNAIVAPTMFKPLDQTQCTFCGQCVSVCPVGALTEMSQISKVWRALNDSSKTVVVQTAPAVRAAIGEEFGIKAGTAVTNELVTALRMLGFDKVFDTDFAADLTIIEEASELIDRIKNNKNLPILTSCCPGWVKFFEHQFPELLDIPSTAKSPQQMFGAIAKSYYADKIGVKKEDIVVVSVMPCLAKKYEASRDEFSHDGIKDVDHVISTRELAKMIRESGINFNKLPPSDYDNPLGESSGASVLFGATGGVLEAALRTAADWLTGEDLQAFDFHAVRGLQGIKETKVSIADMELNIAVASGLGNARILLDKIKRGEAFYHAIEIMACPGGCINGGGQPFTHGDVSILEKRRLALYKEDSDKRIRKSHKNPSIIKLYDEFLDRPGSKKAHKLLHTHYFKRD